MYCPDKRKCATLLKRANINLCIGGTQVCILSWGAPVEMNELIVLEQIHLFVEALDGYFNSGEYITIIMIATFLFEILFLNYVYNSYSLPPTYIILLISRQFVS